MKQCGHALVSRVRRPKKLSQIRLTVRTRGFHPRNRGSTPLSGTMLHKSGIDITVYLHMGGERKLIEYADSPGYYEHAARYLEKKINEAHLAQLVEASGSSPVK